MLRLAWRHRWGCCTLLAQQVMLLAMALVGLGLTGLAIDIIRHEVDPASAAPAWPVGFTFPPNWSALTQVLMLAGAVLLLATMRAAPELSACHLVGPGGAAADRGRAARVDLRKTARPEQSLLSHEFHDLDHQSRHRRCPGGATVRRGMVLQMVILLLSLSVYLAYMLRIHAGLSLACLASMPVLWLVAATFCHVVRPAYDRNRLLMDRLIQVLSENVRGMRVCAAREQEQIVRFRQANDAVQKQQRFIYWRLSLFTPTSEFLTALNLAVLLGYGGYLVTIGELPLGTGLIVFSGLLQQFSAQVSKMVNVLNSMQQSLAGARRVFEVLDAPIEIHSPAFPRRLPQPRGEITFENVCFDYHAGEPVLDDINWKVRPGQRAGHPGRYGLR